MNITSENRRFDADVFAADGDMAQVPVGRSPQANAGFRNKGERGTSSTKLEVFPNGR